jgi:hypothetical protein
MGTRLQSATEQRSDPERFGIASRFLNTHIAGHTISGGPRFRGSKHQSGTELILRHASLRLTFEREYHD